MKFTFTPEELAYLHHNVNQIIAHMPRRLVDPQTLRTFGKMKWKFAPGSLWVSLTQKERSLLQSMLQYRAEALGDIGAVTTERSIVDAVLKKI